ncbi:MAG: SNF2 helicase associated domain-containing protein [Chitinispirillaceae bacterium]|nr:SNF2 helicase associated domain-containing protein [Chitinispirillaceae bacterium]
MACFTEQEIREHTFSAVFDQGRRLFRLNRVGNLSFIDDDIIASVKDGEVHRVIIGREGRRLRFSCNCGFTHAGACEHAVAAMLAANCHGAIQVNMTLGETPVTSAVPAVELPFPALPETGFTSDGQVDDDELRTDGTVRDLPPEKPVLRLYLTERESMLLVEVRFAYCIGRVEFSRFDSAQSRLAATDSGEVVRVWRSRAREAAQTAALTSFDLMQYRTGFYTPAIDPRIWTLQQLPLLAAEGYEIYGHEHLQSTQARGSPPRLTVSIRTGASDFGCLINLSVDNIPATLASLIRAVERRSRFVLLTDGSSGVLPQHWLDTFAALFAALDVPPTSNVISVKPSLAGLVDILCELADEHSCDEEFLKNRERLYRFQGVSQRTLPEGFAATLRPYQQAGFEWFYFLKEFRFGGCLADDMGLGKTVQTLALLLKEKQLGEGQPSLIIVPNSLLFNWQREAKRFTPSLNILIYHGSDRHNYSDILGMADAVLTTYGTIIRDKERLQKQHFHYIILDEAQAIKNPASVISKAVRSLDAGYRLALSGTPIENNLSELWSLFAFLNPGMFGRYRMFLQNFIRPIEREKNERTMEVLQKLVFPFILRRTKAQVVKELPPKNEIVAYCEMVPRQRTLYDMTKQLFYGRITEAFDRAGVEGSRMQLLEGLLRLRQICSHPLLYDPAYTDDSGKFQLVEEMLQDAVAEGHRVLLFSQFVMSLELLRQRCATIGISSELLTGATVDRQKVVDRFQNSEGAPLFLISLKAGGIGLNLTAADYVFHLDPWWNPSVENQASDRAYRIGQTKSVFVYKMITRDSIEERVLELQEKKRRLTESIITTEASFFKHLTKEDVAALFE